MDGAAGEAPRVDGMIRLLIRVILGLVVVLAVAVGALLWRLDQGPVSLAFAQPLLQQLVDRGSPYAIRFEDPKLLWLRQQDELVLELSNAELRTQQGALIMSAPSVRATVAVSPLLLERRLELVSAELELPEIQLKRGADRALVLTFAGKLADVPLGEAAGGGGLGTFLGPGGEVNDPRLAALRLIRVTAPSLQFVDEVTGDRATAADAAFELKKIDRVWSAALGGRIGDGKVELTGAPTTTPGRPDLTLVLQQIQPRALQAFVPDLPLSGLAIPVSGTMRFSIDGPTRQLGAAAIDVTFGAGSIEVTTLGLPPVAVKQGTLTATLEPNWTEGAVQRMELVSDAFTLSATGKAALVDEQLAANVTVNAEKSRRRRRAGLVADRGRRRCAGRGSRRM